MGILGNAARVTLGAMRVTGGGATALLAGGPAAHRSGAWLHCVARDGAGEALRLVGKPHGYYGSATWRRPLTAGAMTSAGALAVEGAGDGALGRDIQAAGSLQLDGLAVGQLIVGGLAAGLMQLNGTASGAGTVGGQASGSLSVSGTAGISALSGGVAAATLTISGAAAASAIGHMAASTDVTSELTAAAIASTVVASLQATTIPVDIARVNGVTVDGTGTSGDPWGPA